MDNFTVTGSPNSKFQNFT